MYYVLFIMYFLFFMYFFIFFVFCSMLQEILYAILNLVELYFLNKSTTHKSTTIESSIINDIINANANANANKIDNITISNNDIANVQIIVSNDNELSNKIKFCNIHKNDIDIYAKWDPISKSFGMAIEQRLSSYENKSHNEPLYVNNSELELEKQNIWSDYIPIDVNSYLISFDKNNYLKFKFDKSKNHYVLDCVIQKKKEIDYSLYKKVETLELPSLSNNIVSSLETKSNVENVPSSKNISNVIENVPSKTKNVTIVKDPKILSKNITNVSKVSSSKNISNISNVIENVSSSKTKNVTIVSDDLTKSEYVNLKFEYGDLKFFNAESMDHQDFFIFDCYGEDHRILIIEHFRFLIEQQEEDNILDLNAIRLSLLEFLLKLNYSFSYSKYLANYICVSFYNDNIEILSKMKE